MANTALITGSYGGLGTCLTNIHAEKGGDLVLVGRSQEKLNAQAKEMVEKYHVKAYTINEKFLNSTKNTIRVVPFPIF